MSVSPIPEGMNNVIPYLFLSNADEAIKLYEKAFGAKLLHRMDAPDGKVMHACIEIGNSKIFLSDMKSEKEWGANAGFYVYFKDVDATFQQAKKAGMQENSAPQDMFWGDRVGNVKDKFGNHWMLATHVRDVSPQELEAAEKK